MRSIAWRVIRYPTLTILRSSQIALDALLRLKRSSVSSYIISKRTQARFRRTVSQIFAERGEEAFREIERNMLHEVAEFEDVLISTGGGAPCFFDNMEFMNASGTTVYLKVSVEELAKRLELCKHTRPVLKGRSGEELRAFIAESLEKRNPFYTKASITFDAEKMLTESDVHDISNALMKIL